MTPERCTFCGLDDDVTVCCSEHPEAGICRLCRNARQGSKFPHRLPDKRKQRREPGVLVPPFPVRFGGDEFRARLDALLLAPTREAT